MAEDDEFDPPSADDTAIAEPSERRSEPVHESPRRRFQLIDVYLEPADVGPPCIWLPVRPPMLWMLTFEQLHQLIDRWLWSQYGTPLSRDYMFFCANGLSFGRGAWAESCAEWVDYGSRTEIGWDVEDRLHPGLGYWRPHFESYLTLSQEQTRGVENFATSSEGFGQSEGRA
jgi:hypothetical protein